MSRDFDALMPAEKALAAQQVLGNPVFNHIVSIEIAASTDLAINSYDLADRDSNRYNVIWLKHLLFRLNQLIQDNQSG